MQTTYYITGNTYAARDALRTAGCRWDAARRCWSAPASAAGISGLSGPVARIVRQHDLDWDTTAPAPKAACPAPAARRPSWAMTDEEAAEDGHYAR